MLTEILKGYAARALHGAKVEVQKQGEHVLDKILTRYSAEPLSEEVRKEILEMVRETNQGLGQFPPDLKGVGGWVKEMLPRNVDALKHLPQSVIEKLVHDAKERIVARNAAAASTERYEHQAVEVEVVVDENAAYEQRPRQSQRYRGDNSGRSQNQRGDRGGASNNSYGNSNNRRYSSNRPSYNK